VRELHTMRGLAGPKRVYPINNKAHPVPGGVEKKPSSKRGGKENPKRDMKDGIEGQRGRTETRIEENRGFSTMKFQETDEKKKMEEGTGLTGGQGDLGMWVSTARREREESSYNKKRFFVVSVKKRGRRADSECFLHGVSWGRGLVNWLVKRGGKGMGWNPEEIQYFYRRKGGVKSFVVWGGES